MSYADIGPFKGGFDFRLMDHGGFQLSMYISHLKSIGVITHKDFTTDNSVLSSHSSLDRNF